MINVQLQITNMSGKIISNQGLTKNQDQHLVDTRNYKTGIYLLSIIDNGKVLETLQLNVTK